MTFLQQNNLRSALKHRGTRCLNCEHPLDISDKYCPQCGQINSTKKLSFDDFFNEFFAGVFAYDSRIRRTLITLLFNPGKISCDYIFGKRVRYANPFRFYLSASIIFFILWNLTGDYNTILDNSSTSNKELSIEEREEIQKSLEEVPGEANKIFNPIFRVNEAGGSGSYLDDYVTQEKLDSLPWYSKIKSQAILYNTFYNETDVRAPFTAIDSLRHRNSTYNRWVFKKVLDWNIVIDNPSIFYNYFIGKLPFIIFFYLPVFALFIWLLYLRRPFNYMEHLIFAFHVQTTFFVLMALGLILNFFFSTDSFTGVLSLLFLFYLYKAMRRFYCQGRFKTLVKFILLNGIFTTLAIIAAIFSLLASFAIF